MQLLLTVSSDFLEISQTNRESKLESLEVSLLFIVHVLGIYATFIKQI